MPISPEEFLEFARTSIEEGSEFSYRNSASRAYYCAYHCCKVFAHGLPKQEQNMYASGSHELVRNILIDNDERALAYMLNQGKSIRSKADYALDNEFSRGDSEEQIGLTDKILQKIGDAASR